ncbi:MAG: hypothetical protein ACF8NJ_08530 [Phycisphaerales bacterium JB038]
MLFKVCRSAGVVLALTAGPVLAADDTVEHILAPAADSYNYAYNQPHGALNFFPLFTDEGADLQSVGMIAYDLTGLGVDPAAIIAVRLEFTVASAQNNYGMGGPSGVVQVYDRSFGFDESDPNPPIAMTGDPLVELLRLVNDVSLLSLEGDALTALVQEWVTDPQSNNGLALALIPEAGNTETFWMALRTKEWSEPSQHPRLIVTELIPAPSTGLLVMAGALSSLRRRR